MEPNWELGLEEFGYRAINRCRMGGLKANDELPFTLCQKPFSLKSRKPFFFFSFFVPNSYPSSTRYFLYFSRFFFLSSLVLSNQLFPFKSLRAEYPWCCHYSFHPVDSSVSVRSPNWFLISIEYSVPHFFLIDFGRELGSDLSFGFLSIWSLDLRNTCV